MKILSIVATLFAFTISGCASSQPPVQSKLEQPQPKQIPQHTYTCCFESSGCMSSKTTCETPECAKSELMQIAPPGTSSAGIKCTIE